MCRVPGRLKFTTGLEFLVEATSRSWMTNHSERKMLDFIHRENLDRLERLLASATEGPTRDTLRRRIAEEKAAHASNMARISRDGSSDD